MRSVRPLLALLAVAIAALACDPAVAWAQNAAQAWPPVSSFERGPGFYLSAWKIGAYWLLFALWVATTDWLSRDAVRMKRKPALWNSASVGSFVLALVLLFLIPWFALGYFLLLAAHVAPLATYIVLRNKAVEPADRVLDRAHLRVLLSQLAAKAGLKVAAEKADPRDAGIGVNFTPLGATERDNSAALLKARNLPGYVPARELVYEALQKRADGILLDYGREKVAVRHQIDGVWLNAPNQTREKADPALAVLKTLAVLNPAERRARQAGKIGIESGGVKYECRFSSQGTETGERAVMVLENKKLQFNTLEELGMRAKLIEQVSEALRSKKGMMLLSAMPAGGLSTLFDVTLNATDRFVRNLVAVEAADAEREILNIAVTRYNPAKGESPATVLPTLIRTYPDVFVVRDLVNAETASILCEQVNVEDRFVFCSARAKEAVEALLRVLMLKAPPPDFAKAISMAINGRLIRKLCETCKEAYAPPPEIVQKFGLPQKLSAFYRPPTKPIDPKHPEKKCEACGGIGYVGRTGFYEVLTINDAMRQILAKQPKLELLRAAASKARHRSLQEEGMLLVARGVTSLQELVRVMKG